MNIAALIGSRICHDLISPIGAINNGLELLEMSGAAGAGPEMALISQSCADAAARIRFFRVAFGSATDSRTIGAAELREILKPLIRPGRLRIDWLTEDALPRPEAQIGFLALLCAENALPRGGAITVDHRDGRWHVVAEGESIATTCSAWRLLEGAGQGVEDGVHLEDLPPARVQFLLLPQMAAIRGRRVEVTRHDRRLEMRI